MSTSLFIITKHLCRSWVHGNSENANFALGKLNIAKIEIFVLFL
jgi:hypothetical protein